jgi:phosphate acetyltransferase
MSKNLYICASEPRCGKSAVALGMMESLLKNIPKVGFFRPIINASRDTDRLDNDLQLIKTYFHLEQAYQDMYAYTLEEAMDLISQGRETELLEGILAKYSDIEDTHDFVLCEGTDFEVLSASIEFDINANIAINLNCPILMVANGLSGHEDEENHYRNAVMAVDELNSLGCHILATLVVGITENLPSRLYQRLTQAGEEKAGIVFAIPFDPFLRGPSMQEVAEALHARVLYGKDHMDRIVLHKTVAAMQIGNFLMRIHNKQSALIVTPGDRSDILLGSLAASSSQGFANIAGLVLTGGLLPDKAMRDLLDGLKLTVPVLSVSMNTFETTCKINEIHSRITASDTRKISTALNLFQTHVDADGLLERISAERSSIMTPKMFEFRMLQRARSDKRHIVLPEGKEERILRAAEILIKREVVDITLIGNESDILEEINRLGLDMPTIRIVDPIQSEWMEDFVQTYHTLRKEKGITLDSACDFMTDASFFGTMMVYKNLADGMVSGSVHTTQHTIRPALQIIKTKPGFSIISSVFFMCLEDHVLVYGDCAVNPNPSATELAEIAVTSAETAAAFGIDPYVAMLSYSTGSSGKGAGVEKVREATLLAQARAPHLPIDGPIQYDAAVDPDVARTKAASSPVAGHATVLIFPDLNTGNNTYKAVQRSANAVAIGPIMQGMRKPVNDLSRGCTITDIVNTVIITAIQAQAEASS